MGRPDVAPVGVLNDPVQLRLGWRTWCRAVPVAVVVLAAGVLALTAGAGLVVRVVTAVLALWGGYWVVDLVVAARFWRFTADAVKVPSLRSSGRMIPRSGGIEVSLDRGRIASVRISGSSGERTLRVNPLVSPVDLRRWFDRATLVG